MENNYIKNDIVLGNLTVEHSLDYRLNANRDFMDYYMCSIDEQITTKVNDMLYEFAKNQKVALPWVCENFEVVKSFIPSVRTYSEDEITKTSFTYELKLQPKKGTVLNPYLPKD